MAASPDVELGPTPEFPALMAGQLTSMRDNVTLTDFTITVKDSKTKLPCHKVILAIHSDHVRSMLTTNMMEAATNTVHFEGISLETMKLILDYCYSEQISFSSNQLMLLISASNYLQIEQLKKRCVNAVEAALNPDNVLDYLTFANERDMNGLEDIKTWCMKTIVESFSNVCQQPAFLDLSYKMFLECVKEAIGSSETHFYVLYAICKWVNENFESRGWYLEELVGQLDKLSLSPLLYFMLIYSTTFENCKVFYQITNYVRERTATINASTRWGIPRDFLNQQNVLQFLTLAGKHGLPGIKTWCLDTIARSFPQVCKQQAFLALSYAEVRIVIDKLADGDSDYALRAVFQWVNANVESREQYLEELLDKVQLDKCYLPALRYLMDSHKTLIQLNVKVVSLLTSAASKLAAAKDKLTKKSLVIVGGKEGSDPNHTCWSVYTKAKTLTISFHIPRDKLTDQHNVCKIPEGFALTGGADSDQCALFLVSTMSWLNMPTMMRVRCTHGSIYIKGILYVLCGYISGNKIKSASVDCLTLASGEWKRLPDSPIDVCYPNVAELNGNPFMLDSANTNKLYTFEKNKWDEKASLPDDASTGASMIAVNGQLCVAGGGLGICAWYNPTTDSWSMSEKKPNKAHCFGSMVQVDATTLMLLGGSYNYGTDVIEVLNIEDESWSVNELKMPANLYSHHALILDMPKQMCFQCTELGREQDE